MKFYMGRIWSKEEVIKFKKDSVHALDTTKKQSFNSLIFSDFQGHAIGI